jgi:hypothetical protein
MPTHQQPLEPAQLERDSQQKIAFNGVDLLKARERDPAIPFSQHDCLRFLAFIWNDLLNDFDSYASNAPGKGCAHLNVSFMSGFSSKVGAQSAALYVADSA